MEKADGIESIVLDTAEKPVTIPPFDKVESFDLVAETYGPKHEKEIIPAGDSIVFTAFHACKIELVPGCPQSEHILIYERPIPPFGATPTYEGTPTHEVVVMYADAHGNIQNIGEVNDTRIATFTFGRETGNDISIDPSVDTSGLKSKVSRYDGNLAVYRDPRSTEGFGVALGRFSSGSNPRAIGVTRYGAQHVGELALTSEVDSRPEGAYDFTLENFTAAHAGDVKTTEARAIFRSEGGKDARTDYTFGVNAAEITLALAQEPKAVHMIIEKVPGGELRCGYKIPGYEPTMRATLEELETKGTYDIYFGSSPYNDVVMEDGILLDYEGVVNITRTDRDTFDFRVVRYGEEKASLRIDTYEEEKVRDGIVPAERDFDVRHVLNRNFGHHQFFSPKEEIFADELVAAKIDLQGATILLDKRGGNITMQAKTGNGRFRTIELPKDSKFPYRIDFGSGKEVAEGDATYIRVEPEPGVEVSADDGYLKINRDADGLFEVTMHRSDNVTGKRRMGITSYLPY